VADTTRNHERSTTARRPGESPELQTRIHCSGRAAGAVLGGISRALSEAASLDRDPLIVLEDLGQLRDSVATLIKGLSRLLVDYPRNVTFWESSGYTEAFLSVMERPRRRPGSN
jgi:hypothetical protein